MSSTRSGPAVASGLPLHTRTLVVEAFAAAGGGIRAEGAILDLRKCGFVPTGGELQTAGFIHHMKLRLDLAPDGLTIAALESDQPTVAFEPTPVSAGESCRDPAPRLRALVGQPLDGDYVRRLATCFGGPLGCSHLQSLALFLGASLRRWLAHGAELPRRRAGERIAKRTLFLDGFERDEGALELAVQLSEFVMRPEREVEHPLDRLARQHELRLSARLEPGLARIEALAADERTRSPDTLATAGWRSRDADLAGLVGGPPLRGSAARVLAEIGDAPADEPLRDALLNLAPGVIQCLAALSHRLVAHFQRGKAPQPGVIPRELSVGGYPDSCYMWRSDGAMARTRFAPRSD